MTNYEKRKAVVQALWKSPMESDNAIAKHVGVSRQFVRNERKLLGIPMLCIEQVETTTKTENEMKKDETLRNYFGDEIAGYVFKTTDYDSFKQLIGNRAVASVRARSIIESIQDIGVRRACIVVNKNKEVVDGQGRLEACRQTHNPVYYVVDEDADIAVCRRLNTGMKNWSTADWVFSWAQGGNSHFVKLAEVLELTKKYNLPDAIIVSICMNVYGTKSTAIKEGTFTMCKTESEVLMLAEQLSKASAVLSKVGGHKRDPLFGILFCLEVKGCDRERLLKKMEQNALDATAATQTAKSAIQWLENIYNARLQNDSKRIYFTTLWKEYLLKNSRMGRHACDSKDTGKVKEG